jgi:hypothetical protein
MARIDDYKESFRLASLSLKEADLDYLARSSGSEIVSTENGEREIKLSFLGTPYMVRVGEEVDVTRDGQGGEVSLPEKILICHYLLHSSGEPLSNEFITFRQIPDGHFYFDAFQRRARDPFVATFGRDTKLFRECAQMLGGRPIETGDVGMSFQVLPRVPIQLVIWEGDDELPPDGTILFDSTIQRNLSAEDIAVLSGMLVYRLMGIARSLKTAV